MWPWIIGYFVLGLVVALTLFMRSGDSLIPESNVWHLWLREALVVPLTLVAMAAVWPFVLVPAIGEFRDDLKRQRQREIDRFSCRPAYMISVVSQQEAEAHAVIDDPKGRVPAVPFGHLNAGWNSFLALRRPRDELWSFEAPQPAESFGGNLSLVASARCRGYALVRARKVIAEFVYEGS